ncbi:hypothetical protein ACF0H5_011581 [Mactra antiquata]
MIASSSRESNMLISIKKPKESHLYPCCQKCSCEDDCQQFGNCCPDKILKPGVTVKYPCVNLGQYLNIPRGLESEHGLVYRIVDDCPSIMLSLLYPKCFISEDIEDFIVVSDPVTDRIYKNKHCALCNGVNVYTKWDLTTNCDFSSIKLNASRSEWYSYIVRNCSLTPQPQKWTDGLSVKCYQVPRKIMTCNYTGRWKQQDDDVQDACEADNQYTNNLLYQEVHSSSVTYRNAYCQLCNAQEDEVWPDLCTLVTIFGFMRGTSQFAYFINYIDDSDTTSKSICLQSEIWDPYNEICTAVSCPSTTFFLQNKCENLLIALPGQAFAIIFNITSNIDNYAWKKEDVVIIDRSITQMLQNADCFQCGTYLMKKEISSPDSYTLYEVKTQDTCTQRYLVKKMQELMLRTKETIRKDNATTFILTLDLDFNPSRVTNLASHGANTRFCPMTEIIDRKMVDVCPRIVLPLEYSFNVTSFKPKTIRGGTICVDEYFSVMKSIHNSQIQQYPDPILLQSVLIALYLLYNMCNNQ